MNDATKIDGLALTAGVIFEDQATLAALLFGS